MATSGTTAFNMPVHEIIEEAFERLGGEHISGNEAKSARRSLNLLFIDLMNRGYTLAKLDLVTLDMVDGQREYTLDTDVIDVISAVLRRDGTDLPMERVSVQEDLDIPTKTSEGRPFQYTIDRDRDAPILKVWLTPENSTDDMIFWAVKKPDDVTSSRQTIDFSTRYLPAIISGLTYYLAFKRRDIPFDYRQELKKEYEEQLAIAFEEDRERGNFYVRPVVNRPL